MDFNKSFRHIYKENKRGRVIITKCRDDNTITP